MPEADRSDANAGDKPHLPDIDYLAAKPDDRHQYLAAQRVEPRVAVGLNVGFGIAGYILVATAVVILILGAFAGVQTWRISGLKKDVAVERAKLLSFVADYNAKAAAETAKYREIEQHLVVTRDSIQKAHDANIQTVVLVADDFAAESRRLQQHAASAPSRRRDPPTAASCAADRGRAEAAGILLAGYVQADVERTALLERRERDIEALSGWILTVRSAVNERSRKPHDAVAQAGAD